LTNFDENNLPSKYSLNGVERGPGSQLHWLKENQWNDITESQVYFYAFCPTSLIQSCVFIFYILNV
jgi:hypothetical protein